MNHVPCEHSANAAGWVLGALSPEEAERFATHLETCATRCMDVARLTEAAERLADGAPTLAPPPALRDRLMASVHVEPSLFDAAREEPQPLERAYRNRPRGHAGGPVAGFATLAIVIATLAIVIAAIILLTAPPVGHVYQA